MGNSLESILLIQPSSTQSRYPTQRKDVSYGRDPNNLEEWRFFTNPGPGKKNPDNGMLGFAAEPTFSQPGGVYTNAVEIILSSIDEDAEIRYTMDGSPPTETSNIYKTAIQIEESASVRAIAFRPGYESSEIVTQTYLIRDSITLPIISLVTDPPNLWDSKTGIYANATSHGFAWERPVTMECFDIDGQKKFDVNAGLRIHGGASRTRSEKKSFPCLFSL